MITPYFYRGVLHFSGAPHKTALRFCGYEYYGACFILLLMLLVANSHFLFGTWNSMAILIAMEIFLVLITASAGVIEGLLEMARDSLGGFMRS